MFHTFEVLPRVHGCGRTGWSSSCAYCIRYSIDAIKYNGLIHLFDRSMDTFVCDHLQLLDRILPRLKPRGGKARKGDSPMDAAVRQGWGQ